MIILITVTLFIIYKKYIVVHYCKFGPEWHERHLKISMKYLIRKPWLLINCWNLEKQKYFMSLFQPLSFIPLFSPIFLLGLPNFLQNLVTVDGDQTLKYLWHMAVAIPFIFIGFIYGLKNILKIIGKFAILQKIKPVLSLIIILYILLAGVPLYYDTFIKRFIENRLYISCKPDEYKYFERIKDRLLSDDSVFVQANLLLNLSNRKKVYWLFNYSDPEQINTDFIVYSPVRFTCFFPQEEPLFASKTISENYEAIYDKGGFIVMARKDLLGGGRCQKKFINLN